MVENRLRILILGGYGTFGSRLARLLADDSRLHLLIAGRSLAKAQALCASLPDGAAREAVRFDRDGDVAAQIAAVTPAILVDASGPFQVYGRDPYRVVTACLAQRVHYIDLADGAGFVAGIGAFDAAAREAKVFALSGASTFPVLTAAVLRRFAADGMAVEHVSGGIAPSPHAGLGLSVIQAIASYAGRKTARLQDGPSQWDHALTGTRRFTIAPPGALPLDNRLFSLIDVPDLRVIPQLWPDLKSMWMGAGPVPEILHRGLILLAWLVRLGALRSLLPLAGLFHRIINVLRWGEHRSGMFIAVSGRDVAGNPAARSWHLLAEEDDGPFVPAMAAAVLIRQVQGGKGPESGARAAVTGLELEDYSSWFTGKRIVSGFRDDRTEGSLYRRMLGDAWQLLPPSLQAMHASTTGLVASGEAIVERGRGPLAWLAAEIMRFPEAGTGIPVRVTFTPTPGGEVWQRDFAGRKFRSVQTEGKGRSRYLIEERFGPMSVALACVVDGERLRVIVRRWSLFGMPMLRFLSPSGDAFEYEQDGRFHFDVELKAPLLGRLVRYRGWLVPES